MARVNYYILRIFMKDGKLYKTFIDTDYQVIIHLAEKFYNQGYSYSVEVERKC